MVGNLKQDLFREDIFSDDGVLENCATVAAAQESTCGLLLCNTGLLDIISGILKIADYLISERVTVSLCVSKGIHTHF